jgi:hypothetical protein
MRTINSVIIFDLNVVCDRLNEDRCEIYWLNIWVKYMTILAIVKC